MVSGCGVGEVLARRLHADHGDAVLLAHRDCAEREALGLQRRPHLDDREAVVELDVVEQLAGDQVRHLLARRRPRGTRRGARRSAPGSGRATGVIALAQTCLLPRSTRLAVASTLDSIEVPMPTTAIWNSLTPSCSQRVDVRAVRLDHVGEPAGPLLHDAAGSRSIASTSCPSRFSASAIEAPNRPSPITSTASLVQVLVTQRWASLPRSRNMRRARAARARPPGSSCPCARGTSARSSRYLPASGRSAVSPVRQPAGGERRDAPRTARCRAGRPVIGLQRHGRAGRPGWPDEQHGDRQPHRGGGIRRPKASTSLSPRASASTARNSTASVVTLMPPAVDALPPPMNISMSVASQVSPRMAPTSSVAKPPERGITAMNSVASTLSPSGSGPSVRGLVHSNAPSDQHRHHEQQQRGRDGQLRVQAPPRAASARPGRPPPAPGSPTLPTNTPTASGTQSHQSPTASPGSPPGCETNPALLKALIA